MSKAKDIADKFRAKCEELGWYFTVSGDILHIFKDISPGDKEDFAKADSEYYWILSIVPTTRPGSIWGTDGGGVGALEALSTGLFHMKKSGGNKNVLKLLRDY